MNTTKQPVYLDPDIVDQLQDRLARIEGHVRGVRKMLDEKKSCDDILHQFSAIRSAIMASTTLLLQDHLRTCVKESAKGAESDKAIDRFSDALSSVLKSLG